LKHSQVIRLIESIEDPRDRLIVRTIYATGVRVSELCGINIEDIDFEDGTIRVRGKGGKIRIVFVDSETLDEMDKFIGSRIEGPLFPGQMGHNISPRAVQHIFRNMLQKGSLRTRSVIAMQVNCTGVPRISVSSRRTLAIRP